jgi:hypothetical protein
MAHVLACPLTPVEKLFNIIPAKYIEALEQNQKIASCCRHPETHRLEAWFSCEAEAEKGIPDIYIFHCDCGRKHRRFCVGNGDVRPFWSVA